MRKDGLHRHKRRVLQRFECKSCWRKFHEKSHDPFHRLRYASVVVVLALMLQVQMGVSGPSAVLVIRHVFRVSPHPRTLQRWVTRFTPRLLELQRRLRPKFSPVWMVDELFCNRHAHNSKRKPSPKYLYTVLDSLRQVVACLVTDKRDAASAERVILDAVANAGFTPTILSRDGCGIYDKARRRLRGRLKGTRWVNAHFKTVAIPTTKHERVVTKRRGPITRRRRGVVKVTQNHIERYHCAPRARENSMRGVKTAASGTTYFRALGVAHNLFQPHEAHAGRTPAEGAGWSPGLSWSDLPRLMA